MPRAEVHHTTTLMTFSDIIGQEAVVARLRYQLTAGRVAHAQLLAGPEGCGKLAAAMALAGALLCTDPHEGEACGGCAACRMAARLAHPDLHFAFPVFKPAGQGAPAVSDQYLAQWRELVTETRAYFGREEWMRRIGVANQQLLIGVGESDLMLRKLSLKASQGGRKVMVVWQPELMNLEAANKLLKILEEPPADTVFLLVSDEPDRLLPTILSRTQRVDFRPLPDADVARALMERNALQEADAKALARQSAGSYVQACRHLAVDHDEALFFDMFVLLMRLSYMRKIKDMHAWAEQVAGWGRERQKCFLDYCQRLVRENFVYNFSRPELNYMTAREADFAVRFARFINERNVIGIMNELADARRDVAQNVNPRMVFFDFALKMIVLLIQ